MLIILISVQCNPISFFLHWSRFSFTVIQHTPSVIQLLYLSYVKSPVISTKQVRFLSCLNFYQPLCILASHYEYTNHHPHSTCNMDNKT